MTTNEKPKTVDLVIQGGGVKGIAALGAVLALNDAGYEFGRIAGTSAGAIVASLVAAYQRAGEDLHEIEALMRDVDYSKFEDGSFLERHTGLVGPGLELLLRDGMHTGDYVYEWLGPLLEAVNVTTFGDLRIEDPESSLLDYQSYALVVAATDLSRKVVARLPWDYDQYDQPADKQRIVDAVRASMSYPFFFRPFELTTGKGGKCTFVDGGLLANFPITIFDRTDGKTPRWPTYGIKLGATPEFVDKPVTSAFGEANAILNTLTSATHNQYHLDDEGVGRRTVVVDTSGISSLDFSISQQDQKKLFTNGVSAGKAFLQQLASQEEQQD
jgi:NTE family protein